MSGEERITEPSAQRKGTSAAAIISIIFAVIAFITALVPIINNFAFIAAILALICGAVGVRGTGRGKKGGRGLAIAGLVIAIISLAAVLISQSIYGAAIDAVSDSIEGGSVSEQVEGEAGEAGTDASGEATDGAQAEESAYSVKIGDCSFGRDYDDSKIIIVEYTFTNNDGDKTSASAKCTFSAYQDGAELEEAFFSSDVDSTGYTKDVKKGGKQTFQLAYVLDGKSDVEVEVSSWFFSDDEVIASKTFAVK